MARLVVAAAQILDYVGGVLIVPQSVLVQQYWHEIRAGLESAGIRLRHSVLHAGRAELTRRIASDPAMPNSPWRLEHLDDYEVGQVSASRRSPDHRHHRAATRGSRRYDARRSRGLSRVLGE